MKATHEEGIEREDAEALLDQLFAKQISRSDFWCSLGFDFDKKEETVTWGGSKTYLINPKKPSNVAHIFVDGDTVCRMFLSGGLGYKQKFITSESPEGRKVCHNCLSVMNGG